MIIKPVQSLSTGGVSSKGGDRKEIIGDLNGNSREDICGDGGD